MSVALGARGQIGKAAGVAHAIRGLVHGTERQFIATRTYSEVRDTRIPRTLG